MLDDLLQGIAADPREDRWLVLADYLEEYDDPRRAELLRLHRRLLATAAEPEGHAGRAAWQARVAALLAEGVRPCVPQTTLLLGKRLKIPLTFSFIPPGAFLMGSPAGEAERGEDEKRHRVTLTRGYWLGVHPVTQAQWRFATGGKPSRFKGADLPVENVSWDDCQTFIEELGRKTGKAFGLPTEAQWEYACRAGTATPFHFGETISTGQANYDGDHAYGQGKEGVYREKTTPVGSFPANAFGLYDVHGNVWEWCQDWYGGYPEGNIEDPIGGNFGSTRVLRGGSWRHVPRDCRSACRWYDPGHRLAYYGCRVLLSLD